MIRSVVAVICFFMFLVDFASAQSCGNLIQLSNGTPADAMQVMQNFNTLASCINSYAPVRGGYLNKIRNSALEVWQRGTSALTTATSSPGKYTADGWQVQQTGAAFNCAQAPGTAGASFSLQCVGGASNTDTVFRQPIESYLAAPLAGAVITVQFQFKQDTGSAITPKLSTCFASATDNFATCTPDLVSTSLTSCATGVWCTEAYTLNASNAGTGYRIEIDCNTALSSSQHCSITAVEVRVTPGVATGVNANPPPVEIRDPAAALALNQRYYVRLSGSNVQVGNAQWGGSTGQITVNLPVVPRSGFTGISTNAASDVKCDYGTSTITSTSVSWANRSMSYGTATEVRIVVDQVRATVTLWRAI